jgi:hypothetical protein
MQCASLCGSFDGFADTKQFFAVIPTGRKKSAGYYWKWIESSFY